MKKSLISLLLLAALGSASAQQVATAPLMPTAPEVASVKTQTPAANDESKPKAVLLLRKDDGAGKAKSTQQTEPSVVAKASGAANVEAPELPAPKKLKPAAEQMPGLGVSPGEYPEGRSNPIKVGADRNEKIFVSLKQLNRISTPFESPQAVDATGATLKQIDQDIYFLPSSLAPTTIYITGGPGQTIGLTVVPQETLPAQTFVLQPEGTSAKLPAVSGTSAANDSEYVATDYVGKINSIIRQLCLDKTPTGFTKSSLPRAVATASDVLVVPKNKYAGTQYDVYSYTIKSTSSAPIEMKEEAFYTKMVRAVAFYPSAVLQRGEETSVFVIADRPAAEEK